MGNGFWETMVCRMGLLLTDTSLFRGALATSLRRYDVRSLRLAR